MHFFNISVFQFGPQDRSIQGNLEFIEDKLSGVNNALVVLPELFLGSAYSIEPMPVEELASTLNMLVSLSKSNALTLVGSLGVLENDDLYNRAIAIANGELHTLYDKQKLFKEEKETFNRGKSLPTYFTFSNLKVSCQICLDVIDPLVTNFLTRQGIEILCVPASFSINLLPKVIQARSLENQIITLFANRCGIDDGRIQYHGKSSIFLPNGESHTLGDKEEELKVISVDSCLVKSMRETRKFLEIDEGKEA